MAMQINKGRLRKYIKAEQRRFAKKLHRRQKRRELKYIDKPNSKYNRYTDGWCM